MRGPISEILRPGLPVAERAMTFGARRATEHCPMRPRNFLLQHNVTNTARRVGRRAPARPAALQDAICVTRRVRWTSGHQANKAAGQPTNRIPGTNRHNPARYNNNPILHLGPATWARRSSRSGPYYTARKRQAQTPPNPTILPPRQQIAQLLEALVRLSSRLSFNLQQIATIHQPRRRLRMHSTPRIEDAHSRYTMCIDRDELCFTRGTLRKRFVPYRELSMGRSQKIEGSG